MNNNNIIQELEQALNWEDQFILKYDDEDFFELIKLTYPKQAKEIRNILQENIKDTIKHQRLIRKLIEKKGKKQ